MQVATLVANVRAKCHAFSPTGLSMTGDIASDLGPHVCFTSLPHSGLSMPEHFDFLPSSRSRLRLFLQKFEDSFTRAMVFPLDWNVLMRKMSLSSRTSIIGLTACTASVPFRLSWISRLRCNSWFASTQTMLSLSSMSYMMTRATCHCLSLCPPTSVTPGWNMCTSGNPSQEHQPLPGNPFDGKDEMIVYGW